MAAADHGAPPVRDLSAEALRLLSAQVSAAGKAPAAGDYLLDYKIVHRQSEAPPTDVEA